MVLHGAIAPPRVGGHSSPIPHEPHDVKSDERTGERTPILGRRAYLDKDKQHTVPIKPLPYHESTDEKWYTNIYVLAGVVYVVSLTVGVSFYTLNNDWPWTTSLLTATSTLFG